MSKKKSKKYDLSKTKISVSLDPENVKWLEQQVKSMKFRSVSHGLDFALSELKKKIDAEQEEEEKKRL